MSFALFLVGLVLLVAGMAWGLSTMGLAPVYIGVACLIVLGIGIMMAVSRTRAKDPSV
jgi:hypothetical protein